ncbi:MAG: protein-export chaperone SecB [Methylococcaceae bacterium]
MNIQFIDTKVTHLNLAGVSQENLEDEDEFKFSFTPAFSELELNEFLIIFNVSLKIEDEFFLMVEYVARFSVDGDIDEVFKESNFVKMNAPAIAYPFLRAYIGNLTLSSGFSPIVLPTINFTKFL